MSLLRHIGSYCACTHACIPVSDAAEQIAADRLPVFQRKDTDSICGRGVRLAVL